MEKLIVEHKKVSFSILSIILFYFFILQPLEKTETYKSDLNSKIKENIVLKRKENILLTNIENLKKQKQELEKVYADKQKQEKTFSSLGEVQNQVNSLLDKHNLKLLELGRVTLKNENIYIIPYSIDGSEDDIFNFLFDLDEREKIVLLNTPIELKRKNDKLELSFSIETKINLAKEIENSQIIRKTFLTRGTNKLKVIKYKFFNNKKGVFYIKDDFLTKRYYFEDGKKSNINGEIFRTILDDKKIILKNLKNNIKTIIYLEDSSEKIDEKT